MQPGADPGAADPRPAKVAARRGHRRSGPTLGPEPLTSRRMIEAVWRTRRASTSMRRSRSSTPASGAALSARHGRALDSRRGRARGSRASRFQYKGLFPALEEAGAAVVPATASKLQGLVERGRVLDLHGHRGCATTRRPCGSRGITLDQICRWPLGKTLEFFKNLKLDRPTRSSIAGDLLREIRDRLQVPGRRRARLPDAWHAARPRSPAARAQRIRLASQLGSGLTGVLYVLDEPTIGLHPRDKRRLLGALQAAARPGQHAGRGRARPRGDRGGRPPGRLRARLGRAGGPGHRRAARRRRCKKAKASLTGRYLARQGGHSRPDQPPARADSGSTSSSRMCARHINLKDVDVRISAGRRHGRDRRDRLGQELAGRGRALEGRPRAAPSRVARFRARTTRSTASSTSTR